MVCILNIIIIYTFYEYGEQCSLWIDKKFEEYIWCYYLTVAGFSLLFVL